MIIKPASAPFSDAHFQRIVAIADTEAGLAIPATKKSLVQSRVTRRMRAIGVDQCGDYLSRLDTDASERGELISVLTTNVSHFYREKHHFEYIAKNILQKTANDRLRFWSAGCSNGQEAYSLAFEILKAIPDATNRDILVLASDIDPRVLRKARSGIYSQTEIEGIPVEDRKRYLDPNGDGTFSISSAASKLVQFRQLNLNGEKWPMKGPFDAILCRNVVIYFSDETQRALWPRFRNLLSSGGVLMLGHSERIHPLENSGFENHGVTTYRKL